MIQVRVYFIFMRSYPRLTFFSMRVNFIFMSSYPRLTFFRMSQSFKYLFNASSHIRFAWPLALWKLFFPCSTKIHRNTFISNTLNCLLQQEQKKRWKNKCIISSGLDMVTLILYIEVIPNQFGY